MSERIDYYLDILADAYDRLMRWLRWHISYYLLPAYRHPMVSRLMPNNRQYVAGAATAVVLAVMIGVTIAKPNHVPAHTSAAGQPQIGIAAPDAVNQPPQPNAPASTAVVTNQPFIFGLGAQLGGAANERIVKDAPVTMLTSWFNRPSDLAFMRPWANDIIPQTYGEGKALHLVVWAGDEERQLDTKYGPACGRAYPLSPGFAADMKELALTFKGNAGGPPLYVSMFTELQTYPCQDNTWSGSENYYAALKDQYRLAQSIFKQYAPNSQVSLTFGGWQASWDDPAKGGGRSLIGHFADVLNTSDFQSFQAMDSTGKNIQHISDMTRILHGYGDGRVMVAHYKPDNRSQAVWNDDLSRVFSPATFNALRANGLFAFSFMDETNINSSDEAYGQARDIIRDFSR